MAQIGLDEAHSPWPVPAPHTFGVAGVDMCVISMPVLGYIDYRPWTRRWRTEEREQWTIGVPRTLSTPKLSLELHRGYGEDTLHLRFNPSDLAEGFDAFHGDLQPMLRAIWDVIVRYVKVLLPWKPWYRAKVKDLHLAKDIHLPEHLCGWMLTGARTTPQPQYGPKPQPGKYCGTTYLGHGGQQLQVCVYQKDHESIDDHDRPTTSAPRGTVRVELRLADQGKGKDKPTGPNNWGLGRPADLTPERIDVAARRIVYERTNLWLPVIGADRIVPYLQAQGLSEAKINKALAAMRACVAEDGGWFDPDKLERLPAGARLQPISLVLPAGAPLMYLDWDRGVVTVADDPYNHVPPYPRPHPLSSLSPTQPSCPSSPTPSPNTQKAKPSRTSKINSKKKENKNSKGIAQRDNGKRGPSRRTECKRKHDLTKDENVYVRKDGKGRECKTCRNDKKREDRQKRKAAKAAEAESRSSSPPESSDTSEADRPRATPCYTSDSDSGSGSSTAPAAGGRTGVRGSRSPEGSPPGPSPSDGGLVQRGLIHICPSHISSDPPLKTVVASRKPSTSPSSASGTSSMLIAKVHPSSTARHASLASSDLLASSSVLTLRTPTSCTLPDGPRRALKSTPTTVLPERALKACDVVSHQRLCERVDGLVGHRSRCVALDHRSRGFEDLSGGLMAVVVGARGPPRACSAGGAQTEPDVPGEVVLIVRAADLSRPADRGPG